MGSFGIELSIFICGLAVGYFIGVFTVLILERFYE